MILGWRYLGDSLLFLRTSDLDLDVLTTISGGLEMLFSNKKRHSLSIPATKEDSKPANISFLVDFLVKNLMKDPRKELFVLDNQV